MMVDGLSSLCISVTGIEDFGVRVACLTPLLMSLPTPNLKLMAELLPFLNCLCLLVCGMPSRMAAIELR